MVYLTFDDGPSSNTLKILDILKGHNIKATFFVVGSYNNKSDQIYKAIVEDGHSIGNHTHSHEYKNIYASEVNFIEDFIKLEDYIYELTNVKMDIMRFPGGSNTTMPHKYSDKKFMRRITSKMVFDGYEYFDWNVDSQDAKVGKQSKEVIVDSVLEGVSQNNPAIVLFHDSLPKTTTVEALPIIIEKLKAENYTFDKLDKDSFYVHFNK